MTQVFIRLNNLCSGTIAKHHHNDNLWLIFLNYNMADIIKPALSEQIDIRPLLAGSVATHTIAEAESRSLQQLFGLGRTSACNIVLIAIDFKKYQQYSKGFIPKFGQ